MNPPHTDPRPATPPGDTLEHPQRDRRRRGTRRAMAWTLAIALAVIALIAWAAYDSVTIERPDDGLATATIDDIIDSPGLYDGRRVTVVGEADETMPAASAFELDDDDLLFDDTLVVINATGEPLDVVEDARYRATGTVRTFDRGMDVDPDLDLDWRLYADLDAEAVLIATDIEPATRALAANE